MKQFEVLQWAFSFLKRYGREEKVAEILLQHYTNQTNTQFFINMQEKIPPSIYKKFKRDVKYHAKTGKPVQYIINQAFFYGREFYVNEHVLIPRFETEELVEKVITYTKKTYKEDFIIADLGTGSGVIAITLAKALPQASIYATDLSENALHVAKKNASIHNTKITFLQGDFLQPLIDQEITPHIIVSNPPYISEKERDSLDLSVKDFEPEMALFAKKDGLAAYETIMQQINHATSLEKYTLFFEIGYEQGRAITKLANEQMPHCSITIHKDINNHDRILCITTKQ